MAFMHRNKLTSILPKQFRMLHAIILLLAINFPFSFLKQIGANRFVSQSLWSDALVFGNPP